jgi:hypothetical protein
MGRDGSLFIEDANTRGVNYGGVIRVWIRYREIGMEMNSSGLLACSTSVSNFSCK